MTKRGILTMKYPMEHGIITNWDDMERVWHHTFDNELRIIPENHGILITECVLNPSKQSEKICEIFFEKYRIPLFCIANDCTLGFYSEASLTGTIVDSGFGVTKSMTMIDGNPIKSSIARNDFGGNDITYYLNRLLAIEYGFSFTTTTEHTIVDEIKCKLSNVEI